MDVGGQGIGLTTERVLLPLYTFDHPANAALIQAGARPITPETKWQRVLTQETA